MTLWSSPTIHDPDFGAILAASPADGASVVQVRADDVGPEAIGGVVLNALDPRCALRCLRQAIRRARPSRASAMSDELDLARTPRLSEQHEGHR